MTDSDLTEVSNKKLAAGLTGVFLGYLGIHKFLLGYTTPGVVMLVLFLVVGPMTCGLAWFPLFVIGLIEGIIYLTMTPKEFKATYIDGKKEWF